MVHVDVGTPYERHALFLPDIANLTCTDGAWVGPNKESTFTCHEVRKCDSPTDILDACPPGPYSTSGTPPCSMPNACMEGGVNTGKLPHGSVCSPQCKAKDAKGVQLAAYVADSYGQNTMMCHDGVLTPASFECLPKATAANRTAEDAKTEAPHKNENAIEDIEHEVETLLKKKKALLKEKAASK